MKKKIQWIPALLAVAILGVGTVAVAGHGSDRGSAMGASSKGAPDIVDTAVEAGSFKTLAAALTQADLVGTLKGKGPFTVFAPTDKAFAALPEGTVEALLKPENRSKLVDVLTYHVVEGRVLAADAVKAGRARTIQGDSVSIAIRDGKLRINDADVSSNDIVASNGVIHVIDAVLLPPDLFTENRGQTPVELIETAIERGSKLYNHGDRAGCAAVYELTALSLVSLAGDELPESAVTRLQTALFRLDSATSSRSRAWLLRNALDDVYSTMSSAKTARR